MPRYCGCGPPSCLSPPISGGLSPGGPRALRLESETSWPNLRGVVAWGLVGELNSYMASSGGKWQNEDGHSERVVPALFIGESRHPVDPKNRVFLPKRFHAGLPLDEEGNRAGVLMRGFDGCIDLFTRQGHSQALWKVNMDTYGSRRDRNLQRALLRSGHDFTLDASGRLLLPAHLIEIAGIDRDVVLLGVGERIEIWAAERWDAEEADREAAFVEFNSNSTDEPGGQGG
ncbi:MAG TPA: hypothetical protein EYQ25_03505 [Planctomycetes bacterium]|nr:hypothetical protein [Planctomycetota bacterium]HIL35938.1 hypothetical protein [Planctomycetota bacterium]